LGGYLPIRIVVESGSLPTNTYITWTDPYSGATRKLYFVAGTNRGYVLGTYVAKTGPTVNVGIPVYYVVEGSQVRLYPMEKGAVNPSEACSVVRNAGFGGTYNSVVAILDNQAYDCAFGSWSSTTIGWAQVASSATTASLYPSPTYYRVVVTVGSSTLSLYLSYWYFVDSDPGFFAVKPERVGSGISPFDDGDKEPGCQHRGGGDFGFWGAARDIRRWVGSCDIWCFVAY
jgi:hypothetical protein